LRRGDSPGGRRLLGSLNHQSTPARGSEPVSKAFRWTHPHLRDRHRGSVMVLFLRRPTFPPTHRRGVYPVLGTRFNQLRGRYLPPDRRPVRRTLHQSRGMARRRTGKSRLRRFLARQAAARFERRLHAPSPANPAAPLSTSAHGSAVPNPKPLKQSSGFHRMPLRPALFPCSWNQNNAGRVYRAVISGSKSL